MRNRKEVVIDASGGRDAGKVFILTEMPALQAEIWGARALLALSHANTDIDIAELQGSGMAGVASIGAKALVKAISAVNFDEVRPLLDEMLTCIQFQPDPANKSIVRDLMSEDIEEVATLFHLRGQVLELHIGFFIDAPQSKTTGAVN